MVKRIYIVGPRTGEYPEHSKMITNTSDYRVTEIADNADILYFQGGADIDPKLYGEKALRNTYTDAERDKEDMYYWEKYKELPKIGVCRGGQFLNVMSGGEMWQHVNNHNKSHEITNLLNIPTTVYGPGYKLDVTSVHHQMMIPHAEYGEILAYAEEASQALSPSPRLAPKIDPEVIWYEHTKCLCFQPHPEYNYCPDTRVYFWYLVKYLIG